MKLSSCGLAALFVALTLAFASCAKHVPNLTPAQNVQLSIDQALDVIAHSNDGAEKAAEQLVSSGVVTAAEIRPVIQYCGEVAAIVQQAVKVNQTADPTQRATAVVATLQQIKQLPPAVQSFLAGKGGQSVVALAGLLQNTILIAQHLIAGQTPAPAPAK